MKKSALTLYISALAITLIIFLGAFLFSNYINKKKTDELKATEDKITIDILSLETQYDLLKQSSCSTYSNTTLRQELDTLSSKLSFMEQQVGQDNQDVFRLKRYYSLLEIKDYLLNQKMNEQCNTHSILVLYFYSTTNCAECTTQQYILSAIQDEYPQIEVYSFDYNLDISAVQTLISLHNIPKNPPIIDINGKVYAPFTTLSDMEAVLQPFIDSSTSSSQINSGQAPQATTTKLHK